MCSIDKVSRYFWYCDTKKYRGIRDTSIVKFWYRDISKYRQYRPSLHHRPVMSVNTTSARRWRVCLCYPPPPPLPLLLSGVLIGGGGYMTAPPPLVPGRSPVTPFC